MLQEVSSYIKSNYLIEAGDRIVIGVSGGADSICLLHVLYELYYHKGVELFVVHINHGIRGAEADRDEEFVKQLSESLGLLFFPFSYDIRTIATEEGLSEEEAGRVVRYRSFLEICDRHRCNKIAIAHNKNDNAETVLFHLFRGSGIRGLSGIRPTRRVETEAGGEVTIIRPLLLVERDQIEAFLNVRQLSYCIDQTNLQEDYSRNKLRNRVLTYVTREINTNAVNHIAEAADRLSEVDRYIEKQVEDRFQVLVRHKDGIYRLMIDAFEKEDIVLRKGILYKIMEKLAGSRKNIETKHVEEILSLTSKQVGKQVSLPYGIVAIRDYQGLALRIKDMEEEENLRTFDEKKLVIPGLTLLSEFGKTIRTEILSNDGGIIFPKNSCTKWIDYDKIENALTVRTRKEGDFLQINSQGGTKKLKNYFIDSKTPVKERDKTLLIADGDHIIWIPTDGRMSEKYKISTQTKNILELKIFDVEEKKNVR